MEFDSDDDFDFSDDDQSEEDTGSKPAEDEIETKEVEKKVTGVRHLLELKETLQLDSFSAKKKNRKERKKRLKEKKRLQKQIQAGELCLMMLE